MWRFRAFLPLQPGETPTTLGEGDTPLLAIPRAGPRIGLPRALVKEEGTNPTGSFKARGLSAAVTRAVLGGARAFTLPTAGNAGVAAAAYGSRAGVPVRVYAPRSTPATLLSQITSFGGDLQLIDGHIGDCGRESRRYAAQTGAFDLSTLREPYRIEGKKTLGLELAEQLDARLEPGAVLLERVGHVLAGHRVRSCGASARRSTRAATAGSTAGARAMVCQPSRSVSRIFRTSSSGAVSFRTVASTTRSVA